VPFPCKDPGLVEDPLDDFGNNYIISLGTLGKALVDTALVTYGVVHPWTAVFAGAEEPNITLGVVSGNYFGTSFDGGMSCTSWRARAWEMKGCWYRIRVLGVDGP